MHDAKKLGNRLPDSQIHAVKRLAEIIIPVLAIVGENDIPYMHAAVNYLATKIKHYRTVTIENAAHLPNMDQPELFEILLLDFIESDLVRNF